MKRNLSLIWNGFLILIKILKANKQINKNRASLILKTKLIIDHDNNYHGIHINHPF